MLVDQATRHGSFSSRIAGDVAEHGFSSLKAPIMQVTALDATIPYSEPMEAFLLPDEAKVPPPYIRCWAPNRSPPEASQTTWRARPQRSLALIASKPESCSR